MGPIEKLVLQAWGHGVQIDTIYSNCHAVVLRAVIDEARKLDDVSNRHGCLGCPMVDGKCPHCGNECGL